MDKIGLTTVVSHRNDIISSDLHNEMVMMDVERGSYYGLEEIGMSIWKTLAQPTKVSDLIDQLVAQYQIQYNECEADTIEFLEQLAQENLILVHPQ